MEQILADYGLYVMLWYLGYFIINPELANYIVYPTSTETHQKLRLSILLCGWISASKQDKTTHFIIMH